jgi:hypothetical protein
MLAVQAFKMPALAAEVKWACFSHHPDHQITAITDPVLIRVHPR